MKILQVRKITWEIRDKNGQLKSFEVQRPNSYVQHLVNILYCQIAAANLASQTNTSDGSSTMSGTASSPLKAIAANLDGTYGLVVGNDGNPVLIGHTKLLGKIAHGNTDGTLSHGTVTVNTPSTSGGTRSFTVQRTFTNNGSTNVSIAEIGIYVSTGGTIFMIERALSSKTINHGTSGTLTYTIGTTV